MEPRLAQGFTVSSKLGAVDGSFALTKRITDNAGLSFSITARYFQLKKLSAEQKKEAIQKRRGAYT